MFILVLFNIFSLSAYAAERVHLVADNFPPYIDQNTNNKGIITEVVRTAFLKQNIETHLEILSWSDSENQVAKNNKFSFMWTKNVERMQHWIFSDPIYYAKQIIIAKRTSDFYWKRLDELRNYKLGVTKGHNYGERFNDYKNHLTLIESVSDFISIKRLSENQFDGAVIEKLMGHFLLSYYNDNIQSKIEFINTPVLDTEPSYLVCSKFNAKCFSYIEIFNKGLKLLKSSGDYDRIINASISKFSNN